MAYKVSISRFIRLIEVLIALVCFAIAVTFVLANNDEVSIDILVSTVQVNIGSALLVFLVSGLVLGYLIRLPAMLALKSKYSRLQRQTSQIKSQGADQAAKPQD